MLRCLYFRLLPFALCLYFCLQPSAFCLACEDSPLLGNLIALGPEYYHLKRTRSGGTEQSGNLVGIRFSYDHIKRYHIYFGVRGLYGGGTLHGHTGTDDKIRSHWRDAQIEGNLGYTFQLKEFPYFSLTPFGGYGYFRETNKFVSPSPRHLKFTTHFGYFSYGILSNIFVTPCLSIGLNARFRTPWEPRCKITDDPDPEINNLSLIVESRLQYRIELPIITYQNFLCNWMQFGLTPFYEWREYGKRESYPVSFLHTKIRIFGVNFLFLFQF